MKNNQIRATGASCKECRRLKIKCDKMVPCGTCTKRGLQSLCPDGQLSGAKGSRYVLATAEESWHRIQALCVRVQDLEFALERAHGLVARDRHPLLEEEHIKIGQDPRAVVKTEPGRSPTVPPEDVPIADFGTMKISKSGSYRWLGATALPAMLLDEYDEEESGPSDHVSDTMIMHERGPSIPGHNLLPTQDLKAQALQQLPSRQRALQLIDTFIECYGRWSTIIARSTVIDTLFTVAYDGDASSLSAYNISSLLSILALGCLYDQPYDRTGREFKTKRKWAKTLFFSEWPKGPSTIDELESLLLVYRVSWAFTETNPSENYELLAWGIKLAEKIGLHRDPEPLNLSTDECLRRRRVLWTLWFQDSFASLVLGQPPTLAKGFVDCKPPGELNPAGFEDIHPRTTLIAQDILAHFLQSKGPPPYSTVLGIDQKIRDLGTDLPPQSNAHNSAVTVQSAEINYTRALRSALLIALHKTYFSYAILRPKEDPVAGRLAPSTTAIFEAATAMLESGMTANRYTPWMQAGYAPVWMHYHTAMLVLYAFPTYLPYWPRSEDAMKTADSALTDLFYPTAGDHEQIANSLPPLVKAQQKAQESWAKYQNGQWTHPASATSGQPHELDLKQDMFLNDKFVISSASGYDTSRGSTPSDYLAPSVYPESTTSSSAYRGNWVGFDSPTVVSSETYGHYSQGNSHILSPQQQPEGQFDEANLYKNNSTSSMDWAHAAPPSIPKMESPPHSAGLYPTHSHYPSQHAVQPLPTLQIPGEVIGLADHRPDRLAAIRRGRGLSRAHSFPSDHPAGYSSAGSIQTHSFQSMQVPHNIPSPTTPVGLTSPMHSLEHQHVHEPYGRWIQTSTHSRDPYTLPHSHGYISPPTVPQHNPMSPTDASAIPIHVLEQSWDNFNVQQR